jgi:hypothetical protein
VTAAVVILAAIWVFGSKMKVRLTIEGVEASGRMKHVRAMLPRLVELNERMWLPAIPV